MSLKKKIACMTQCNKKLNRKALCIKKSWDEVSHILQSLGCLKCCCPKRKKKQR